MSTKAAAGSEAIDLGSVGALASLLGARHSSDMQSLVTFKDGRSCVIAGPANGVSLPLQGRGWFGHIDQQ